MFYRTYQPKLLFFLSLVFGLSLKASTAWASNYSVNPINVVLSPRVSTALLKLRNQDTSAASFQFKVFKWEQNAQGEDKLTPTEESQGERQIRLGSKVPINTVEKTYRLIVEEIPTKTSQPTQNAIQILTNLSIPIFLQPNQINQSGKMGQLAIKKGNLSFEINNTGNVNLRPQQITVQGLSATGEKIIETAVNSWYILAGNTKSYSVQLPPKEKCNGVKKLVVEVKTAKTTLKETLDTPQGACAAANPP
jgi:fimbrial chaperone protein